MIKCQVPDNATRALTPSNTQISTSSIPTVFSLTGYERVGKIGGSRDRSEDLTSVISCKFRTIRSVFKIHILLLSCITSLFKKFEQNTLVRIYIYIHIHTHTHTSLFCIRLSPPYLVSEPSPSSCDGSITDGPLRESIMQNNEVHIA